MEEPFGLRRSYQRGDDVSPKPLTKDGDSLRITSKVPDVVLDPLEGRDKICDSVVTIDQAIVEIETAWSHLWSARSVIYSRTG